MSPPMSPLLENMTRMKMFAEKKNDGNVCRKGRKEGILFSQPEDGNIFAGKRVNKRIPDFLPEMQRETEK